MKNQTYQIRICTQHECQLRFPLFENSEWGDHCPRCGSETQHVSTPRLNPRIPLPNQPSLKKAHVEALLDNVRSTWNVGSIFRTADGVGVQHLHLTGITPTPENPKVLKTSIGAERNVPWSSHTDAVKTGLKLIEKGYSLWGFESSPQSESLYSDIKLPTDKPNVLVFGNEISGIDPDLLGLCQRIFWIPMLGEKESLNVAVAFGVAVYSLIWR